MSQIERKKMVFKYLWILRPVKDTIESGCGAVDRVSTTFLSLFSPFPPSSVSSLPLSLFHWRKKEVYIILTD